MRDEEGMWRGGGEGWRENDTRLPRQVSVSGVWAWRGEKTLFGGFQGVSRPDSRLTDRLDKRHYYYYIVISHLPIVFCVLCHMVTPVGFPGFTMRLSWNGRLRGCWRRLGKHIPSVAPSQTPPHTNFRGQSRWLVNPLHRDRWTILLRIILAENAGQKD